MHMSEAAFKGIAAEAEREAAPGGVEPCDGNDGAR
jgi:hypothetical protein